MVDEDDVEALMLEERFRLLLEESRKLADPEQALWAWVELSLAVLLKGQVDGRPLSWVLSLTLQRTIHDIRRSL